MGCDLPPAHELSGRVEILLQVAEQRPALVVVTRGLLEDDGPRLAVDSALYDGELSDQEEAPPAEEQKELGARVASAMAEFDEFDDQ